MKQFIFIAEPYVYKVLNKINIFLISIIRAGRLDLEDENDH